MGIVHEAKVGSTWVMTQNHQKHNNNTGINTTRDPNKTKVYSKAINSRSQDRKMIENDGKRPINTPIIGLAERKGH